MVILAARPYHGRWITHLGCVKHCLDQLGIDLTYPWLYGGTGHAFVLNISPTLCPSGPTAWNTRMLFALAPNLGYRVDGVYTWRAAAGDAFAQKQREAYDLVRASIDQGLPCYGWQLEIPEYYVIRGYDEVGYYFADWSADLKGPLPWQQLATWDVPLLEVYRVQRGTPAPAAKVVSDALAMVLERVEEARRQPGAPYLAGPEGFEAWAQALESGQASRDGHSFNALCWQECRGYAVEFLQAAQEQLPGRCDAAFAEAAAQYAIVRDRLGAALALIPFRTASDFAETIAHPEAAALLRQAGAAEAQALDCLREIAHALAAEVSV
jgi:hypothetical protein